MYFFFEDLPKYVVSLETSYSGIKGDMWTDDGRLDPETRRTNRYSQNRFCGRGVSRKLSGCGYLD